MKPQDIIFLVVFFLLLWKGNPKWLAGVGISCLVVSIPLFYKWIFFTAQHLTWYAGACFFGACILSVIKLRRLK